MKLYNFAKSLCKVLLLLTKRWSPKCTITNPPNKKFLTVTALLPDLTPQTGWNKIMRNLQTLK